MLKLNFFLSFIVSLALVAEGKIAIVIDDIGNDGDLDRSFIQLPREITLAFFPDGEDLANLLKEAKEKGHEILAHVPMEAFNDRSPPREKLLMVNESKESLQEKLLWHLNQVDGCLGINNHTGSAFTTSHAAMCHVMEVLKKKNLFFLDSRTCLTTECAKAASDYAMPFVSKDLFIDNESDAKQIQEQLKKLERIAKVKGQAIGIGHPKKETLEALTEWLKETKIQIVPLSVLVKTPI